MAAIFTQSFPANGSVGSSAWLDAGLIVTGKKAWWGQATWVSPSKLITFELRGNNTGQSAATTAATTLYASSSVRAGNTVSQDLYKNGRLILRSVTGTGVEHWWIRLSSKSATSDSYMATVYYTDY